MKHIENFLGKKNLVPGLDKKKQITEIIQKHTTVHISTKNISFQGKTVFIKASPHEKTQILIHKKNIVAGFADSPILTFFTNIQ